MGNGAEGFGPRGGVRVGRDLLIFYPPNPEALLGTGSLCITGHRHENHQLGPWVWWRLTAFLTYSANSGCQKKNTPVPGTEGRIQTKCQGLARVTDPALKWITASLTGDVGSWENWFSVCKNSNLCPGSVSVGERTVFLCQSGGGRGHPQGWEGRASLALSCEASWDGRAPGSDGVQPACPNSPCLQLTPRL